MEEAMATEQHIDIKALREKGAKFKPSSSTIETATYDPLTRLLIVDFKSGSSYLYYGIDLELWSKWLEAESAGKYFAVYVKPHPRFDKIKKDGDREFV